MINTFYFNGLIFIQLKRLLILSFIFLLNITISQEEKRLALVIGNANYDKGALKNPVNDAELMKETLEKLNFDVIYAINLELDRDMKSKIREFGEKRGEYDVGFVYYAGHGVQVKGDNYLLPTKENFNCEDDVLEYGVNVQTIMKYLKSTSNSINILVLDACRNNPLEQNNCPNSSRSLNDGGLAKIVAPTGSLIAFSTSANTTAADGNSGNSIYCKSLAKNLLVPDRTLSQIFQEVRVEVINQSQNEGRIQEPEESSKLREDYYFTKTERLDFAEKLMSFSEEDYELLKKSFLRKVKNKQILQKLNLKDSNKLYKTIEVSTKIIDLDSKNIQAYLNRGNAYLELEKYTKATDDFNTIIQIDSINIKGYKYRGLAYYANNRNNDAMKDINKALQLDSTFKNLYEIRGNIFHELEDHENAIKDLSHSISLRPNDTSALFIRAKSLYLQDKFDEALNDLNKVITLDSTYSNVYFIRGSILLDQGTPDKFEKALEDFTKEIKIDSNNIDAYILRNWALLYLGDIELAINESEKIKSMDSSSAEPYLFNGTAYYISNKIEKAIYEFEKSYELDSANYNILAQVYMENGESEKALKLLLSKNESTKEDLLLIGNIFMLNNEKKKAIKYYKNCLKKDSSFGNAYKNVGKIYFDMEKYDSAFLYTKKCIECDTSNKMGHVNMSMIMSQMGKLNEAIKYLDEKLPSDYVPAIYNKAYFSFLKGNQEDFQKYLNDLKDNVIFKNRLLYLAGIQKYVNQELDSSLMFFDQIEILKNFNVNRELDDNYFIDLKPIFKSVVFLSKALCLIDFNETKYRYNYDNGIFNLESFPTYIFQNYLKDSVASSRFVKSYYLDSSEWIKNESVENFLLKLAIQNIDSAIKYFPPDQGSSFDILINIYVSKMDCHYSLKEYSKCVDAGTDFINLSQNINYINIKDDLIKDELSNLYNTLAWSKRIIGIDYCNDFKTACGLGSKSSCKNYKYDCDMPKNYTLNEGEQIIYYNKEWKACSKNKAKYYRVITLDENLQPSGIVKDYYINGNLHSEGKLLSFNPNIFDFDKYDGIWQYYFKNGQQSYSLIYENGIANYINCRWNKKGELINCN
jgi:tetratricopeptide (TPR) repeat protein